MTNKNIFSLSILACLSLGNAELGAGVDYKVLLPDAKALSEWKVGVSRRASDSLADFIGIHVQAKKLALKKSLRASLGIPLLKNPVIWVALLGSGIVGGLLAILIVRYMESKLEKLKEQVQHLLALPEGKLGLLSKSLTSN